MHKFAKKVPVIMQMEALECGAACLCMIAAYYKKWIPLTQVRSDCGVSRNGSVAKNILCAGRAYGFEAGGYKMEPADLQNLTLPAILHWDFNHFVVLCGMDLKKGKFVINDPARGRVTVNMDEFDRSFTGIVLSFVPGENFKPEGKPKSVWSFAKKCMKGAILPFLLAVIISIVGTATSIISPISSKVFIDNILSGKNPEWLMPFLGIMLIVLFLQVLIGIINSIYWLKIEGKFAVSSSAEFMWHTLRLPIDFFSQRYIDDISARQNSNADIALTLINKIAPIFVNVASLIFYLFIMINYSWQLTLIGVFTTIFDMFIVKYTSEKLLNFQRTSIPNQSKLANVTFSGIQMIETIKSTGAENGYFERWAGYYAKQNNSNTQMANFSLYFGMIPSFLHQIASTVLLLSGVYMIMDGSFTIGMLTAFNGFLSSFLSPISDLMDVYQSFVQMKNDIDRIEDVMECPTDVNEDVKSNKEEDKLTGNLQINNITFGYSKLAPPLIENFSLSLKPGSSVALVGGSGSGKSTIAKLIMGLYNVWDGEILFDGKKRNEIDNYKFHSSISMVDQDKILFNDTIKNNIKMWDESIEDFAMILAARDADIHEAIIKRPDGYNHVIRAAKTFQVDNVKEWK